MKRSVFLAVGLTSTVAWAGPPVAVHTKDGSVYYGELVERVLEDHITIVTATGIRRRFAWKDLDPSPIPRPPELAPDAPTRGPTETVRTVDGSAYFGEIVEDVPGDHVTLQLVTGELRRVEDRDVDRSPHPVRHEPRVSGPIENLFTRNGSIYHGEILEKVVHDHVTIRLHDGEIETFDWEDLAPTPAPRVHSRRAGPDVALSFTADHVDAELQRFDSTTGRFTTLCRGSCDEEAAPSGRYRVAGRGLQTSREFHLDHRDNRIQALVARRPRRSVALGVMAGAAATVAAGLVLVGVAMSAKASSSCGYDPYYGTSVPCPDNAALDVATVTVNAVGTIALVVGIAMFFAAAPEVRVNGASVARRTFVGLDGLHF